jgi:hypothetical protein
VVGAAGASDDPPTWFLLGMVALSLLLWIVFPLLYFSISESSRWQATLGKLAIGLKVTDANGHRISFWRSFARWFSHLFSALTFNVGYIINVLTARQRTLHDLIAGTLVVHKDVTPTDLANNPAVPASSATRGTALLALLPSLLFSPGIMTMGMLAAIALPAYQDYTIRSKVSVVEQVGILATAAVTAYVEDHGDFPPTLEAAGFSQKSPQVHKLWINPDDGVIHLEPALPNFQGKTLDFVPDLDEDDNVIWTCRSENIRTPYLPKNCRD